VVRSKKVMTACSAKYPLICHVVDYNFEFVCLPKFLELVGEPQIFGVEFLQVYNAVLT